MLKAVSFDLPGAVRDLGAAATLRRYQLQATWAFVVGPALALQSEPTSVKGDTLYVRTSTSIWSQELHFRWTEILTRLRKVLPDSPITHMRCRVARLSRDPLPKHEDDGPDASGVDWNAIVLPRAARSRIDAIVARVEDAQLRESMRRTLLQVERRRIWSFQVGLRPCLVCGDFQDLPVCTPCKMERQRERQTKVFQLLGRRPWSTHRDLQQFIDDLTHREFFEARRRLGTIQETAYRYSREGIPVGAPFPPKLRETIMDLVMMIVGREPSQLLDRHFLKVLGKTWGRAYLANAAPNIEEIRRKAAEKAKPPGAAPSAKPSGQPRRFPKEASQRPDEAYKQKLDRRWAGRKYPRSRPEQP